MKPQLTLQFFRTPFLVLLTALSIGVFLGYSYTVSSAILVVISSISLFLVVLTHLFFKSTNGLFILAIFLVFVLIGFFSMQQSRGEWEANSFEDLYQQEGEIIVKLQEIGNQEKEWVKVIANLQQFQSVLDTVPLNESIVLFIKKSRTDLKVNDLVVCNSIASKIKNARNPGEFDAENYWNKKGKRILKNLKKELKKIKRKKKRKRNWQEKKKLKKERRKQYQI